MLTKVNLICGFLGSGKTTLITHLLQQKPKNERWSILVNEFGELGIDAAFLRDHTDSFIKQVAGGCLCCTNGAPFQVVLNQLLTDRPDRLLIEPSGLGHPQQILALLKEREQKNQLTLCATLSIIDGQTLPEPDFHQHEQMTSHLDAADILITNKVDLCEQNSQSWCRSWLEQHYRELPRLVAQFGQIEPSWLDYSIKPKHPLNNINTTTAVQPKVGVMPSRKISRGAGAVSCGWQFEAKHPFNYLQTLTMLRSINARRVKGYLNTELGWYQFNGLGEAIRTQAGTAQPQSQLEIIHPVALDWGGLENQLHALQLDSNHVPE